MKGAAWLLGGGWRLGLLQKAAGLSARVLWKQGVIGRMPRPLSRWTDARDIPAPPKESFRAWWARTDGGRKKDVGSPNGTPGHGTDQK
jgi:L-lactate dehydrogenase complex protein LldF